MQFSTNQVLNLTDSTLVSHGYGTIELSHLHYYHGMEFYFAKKFAILKMREMRNFAVKMRK